MDKLSEEQRVLVSKMSVDRLRSKLVQAGYKQEDVDKCDRPKLLELYVQLLLTETAYVSAKVQGIEEDGDAEGGTERPYQEQTATDAADRALRFEERRLILEEKRLEEQRMQREEQKLQRQLEEKKLAMKERKLKEESRYRDCLLYTSDAADE